MKREYSLTLLQYSTVICYCNVYENAHIFINRTKYPSRIPSSNFCMCFIGFESPSFPNQSNLIIIPNLILLRACWLLLYETQNPTAYCTVRAQCGTESTSSCKSRPPTCQHFLYKTPYQLPKTQSCYCHPQLYEMFSTRFVTIACFSCPSSFITNHHSNPSNMQTSIMLSFHIFASLFRTSSSLLSQPNLLTQFLTYHFPHAKLHSLHCSQPTRFGLPGHRSYIFAAANALQ